MHGSSQTPADVVQFYNQAASARYRCTDEAHGLPLRGVDQLLAFMESLTDPLTRAATDQPAAAQESAGEVLTSGEHAEGLNAVREFHFIAIPEVGLVYIAEDLTAVTIDQQGKEFLH